MHYTSLSRCLINSTRSSFSFFVLFLSLFSFLPISGSPEVDYQRLFHTPHNLNIQNLGSLVETDVHQVTNQDELSSALNASVGRPGVHIIHALVDAEKNVEIHRLAMQRVAEALSI